MSIFFFSSLLLWNRNLYIRGSILTTTQAESVSIMAQPCCLPSPIEPVFITLPRSAWGPRTTFLLPYNGKIRPRSLPKFEAPQASLGGQFGKDLPCLWGKCMNVAVRGNGYNTRGSARTPEADFPNYLFKILSVCYIQLALRSLPGEKPAIFEASSEWVKNTLREKLPKSPR